MLYDNSFCTNESFTLQYFAAQLFAEEKALVEKHIADCNICCNTLAHLSRLTFSPITSEEVSFINKQSNLIISYLRQLSDFS
ncbi:MAG: hypothetical protein WAQ98_30915 [Blastocatellia bacterium]